MVVDNKYSYTYIIIHKDLYTYIRAFKSPHQTILLHGRIDNNVDQFCLTRFSCSILFFLIILRLYCFNVVIRAYLWLWGVLVIHDCTALMIHSFYSQAAVNSLLCYHNLQIIIILVIIVTIYGLKDYIYINNTNVFNTIELKRNVYFHNREQY